MVARAFERDSLFAVIAGPLVWTAHFLALYVFTAIACAQGFFHHEVLGLRLGLLVGGALTVLAIGLILDGMFISWRRWQGRGSEDAPQPLPPHDRNDPASRRRFMAYAALLLSGIALIATVWETLPILFFASCR
ncbi:MAG: hypothetical protein K0S96_324 [Geminicoccaceae bacterium]|nr:hypothetical protein [Geminicoccaceae bacterium]